MASVICNHGELYRNILQEQISALKDMTKLDDRMIELCLQGKKDIQLEDMVLPWMEIHVMHALNFGRDIYAFVRSENAALSKFIELADKHGYNLSFHMCNVFYEYPLHELPNEIINYIIIHGEFEYETTERKTYRYPHGYVKEITWNRDIKAYHTGKGRISVTKYVMHKNATGNDLPNELYFYPGDWCMQQEFVNRMLIYCPHDKLLNIEFPHFLNLAWLRLYEKHYDEYPSETQMLHSIYKRFVTYLWNRYRHNPPQDTILQRIMVRCGINYGDCILDAYRKASGDEAFTPPTFCIY